ncbi:MAG: hypothetical protein U0R52_11815 [Solirubrobacterales bacterium]
MRRASAEVRRINVYSSSSGSVKSGSTGARTRWFDRLIWVYPFRDRDEAAWERFIGLLETRHRDLGPVLSWDEEDLAIVTLAVDSDDEAHAAEAAVGAIAGVLNVTGLGNLYPSGVEIEAAADLAAA